MAWAVTADVERFDEAVEWHLARTTLTDEQRREIPADARRRAFWVAGVSQLSLVDEALSDLNKAIEDGVPFAEFQQRLAEKIEKRWGGENPLHLETVFRNATQTAYNAGRYEQMRDPEVLRFRPFWMYDAISDGRTTELCSSLDGTIRPADDPGWVGRIPPLHHRCRSSIRSLRESEAKRRGVADDFGDEEVPEGWGQPPDRAPVAIDTSKRDPELARLTETKVAELKVKAGPARSLGVAAGSADDFKEAGIELGSDGDDADRVLDSLEKQLGQRLSAEEVRRLIALHHLSGVEAHVDLSPGGRGVFVEVLATEGQIERRFSRNTRGELEVYHSLLFLEDEHQGRGLGKKILRDQFDAYEKLGVKRIKLFAVDIGRYTWPKMGFHLARPQEFPRIRERFVSYLVGEGHPAKIAEEIGASVNTLTDIANSALEGEKIGKGFLLSDQNESYDLTLDVDTDDISYQKAKAYVAQ